MLLDELKVLIKDLEEILIKDPRFKDEVYFKKNVRTIYECKKKDVFLPPSTNTNYFTGFGLDYFGLNEDKKCPPVDTKCPPPPTCKECPPPCKVCPPIIDIICPPCPKCKEPATCPVCKNVIVPEYGNVEPKDAEPIEKGAAEAYEKVKSIVIDKNLTKIFENPKLTQKFTDFLGLLDPSDLKNLKIENYQNYTEEDFDRMIEKMKNIKK